jgi:DNA modification methylase
VWEIGNVTSKERKEMNHATPKPVALWEKPLNNHTRIGEICYEPFAGSGTQFIAAEQLKRICYGMEIEPKYCDVIVSRWCNFTKQNTVKLNGEEIVWQ